MRLILIIALVTLFASTTIFAGEEKTVTAPFPKTTIDPRAHNFYCNATLGVALDAMSKEAKLVSSGLEKAGVFAKAYHATDKLVLEISDGELYMFRRDDFESGKTTRDFPLEIIENTETNLVAIATGLLKPKGATIVTLNRKTGIGSWTAVESVGLLTHCPRIDSIYLTCGARNQ